MIHDAMASVDTVLNANTNTTLGIILFPFPKGKL